jgi:hypothetical protein
MKILAFDVAKNNGVAVVDDGDVKDSKHFTFKTHEQYYEAVCKILDHIKPEAIVTAKPNRFYNTLFAHAQYIGIISLVAEQRGIPVFLLLDPEIKSWAFPKQKKVTKQEVIDKYGGATDDEADARMMALFADAKLEIVK